MTIATFNINGVNTRLPNLTAWLDLLGNLSRQFQLEPPFQKSVANRRSNRELGQLVRLQRLPG